MRKWALLLFAAGLSLPSHAATRLTVDQLQQLLTTARSKPDADFAYQLAGLELTERLSRSRLGALTANLTGEKSREALAALGDSSAFLDLPAAESFAKPAPAFAEQRAMLARTVAYVGKAIPQLPNFFATQKTTRFEDTPQLQKGDFFIPYQPLHPVGISTATVLYRNGQEALDTGTNKKPPAIAQGLTTRGIFGPILSTVLLDAAHSSLNWSHWERDQTETEAVFSFVVPQEKSHYEVSYCCVATEAATLVANLHPFRRIAGYRGDMAIDPDTGTILRLRVVAELKATEPVVKAAILVEYGPVEIGGKTYICPLKSISSTLAQTVQVDPLYKFPVANSLQPLKKSLNHVDFTDYHVFRAEARLVADHETDRPNLFPSNPSSITANSTPAVPPTVESTSETPPATPAASALASVAGNPPIAPVDHNAEIHPTPTAPPEPEITVSEASSVPDAPARPRLAPSQGEFTLHTTARLVDVGVVAYDKKGHPVTDLKPGDFEIEDNGRKQEIRYFVQSSPTVSAPVDPATAKPGQSPTFSNRRTEPPASPASPSANESRATILLIDSANLAWGDLSQARAEMLRFLKTLPPGEPVGLYILKSYGFQVLTEPTDDHAAVADKLGRWMPSAQDLSRAQDEEQRNRQHFDYVHSVADLAQVNGNSNSDPEASFSGLGRAALVAQPPDPKLQSMGSNPEREALSALTRVARHIAPLPGHKSVVWVASDNVLADWTNRATQRDSGSKFIEPATLEAQEALNNAHASLYPLDASQLEAGGITADIGTHNVLVVGKSDRDKSLQGLGDMVPGMKPGRETAQMQQDTHPIQGTFRQLAEDTGGRALRRASDIATELNSIVEDGRAAYLLSFTPDQPADDKYHLLTVRVSSRKDLKLHYRTGFQYKKDPVSLKDRFRQALWDAADSNEIALTAAPSISATGTNLKLNIGATDLDLAQQGELWTGKLDVFLVERDGEGVHAKLSGQTLGLRLKSATYQRLLTEGVPFEVDVHPSPETASVRMVVVDENSGRMGSVTIPAASLVAKP